MMTRKSNFKMNMSGSILHHPIAILTVIACILLLCIPCDGQLRRDDMDCYSIQATMDANTTTICLNDRPYCRSYHRITKQNLTKDQYQNIYLRANNSHDGRIYLDCLTNLSCPFAMNQVVNMNTTQWIQFANETVMHDRSCCAAVLFYSSICPFSAQLAPMYNAIGHIFPNLTTISVNAHDSRYYNIRVRLIAFKYD